MSQQERGSAVNTSFLHHRYDTHSCAPARRDGNRVIRSLARSFRRVASPEQYNLSLWLFNCRCDSSYWDGRRPAGFLKGGSPALCSRAESGPCVMPTHNEANLRGMRRTSICESVRFRSAYNTTLRPCVQPFPAAFFLCLQPSSAAFPVYPAPAAARTPAGRAWSSPARDGTA